MKITTVLLDAGGVILDESEHEEIRARHAVDILKAHIPDYSLDTYHSDIEEAVRSFCPRAYQYVFWKYAENDVSHFNHLFGAYSEKCKQTLPPLRLTRGFEAEIREISKTWAVGIAGQYGQEILELLETHALLDSFTYRLTQDDFPITKPDPRYYEQILEAFGVAAQECIMVGDRIDKDIIPAKQVGMKTILIRVGLHKNQQPRIPLEIPDIELYCISGLASAVLDLAGRE